MKPIQYAKIQTKVFDDISYKVLVTAIAIALPMKRGFINCSEILVAALPLNTSKKTMMQIAELLGYQVGYKKAYTMIEYTGDRDDDYSSDKDKYKSLLRKAIIKPDEDYDPDSGFEYPEHEIIALCPLDATAEALQKVAHSLGYEIPFKKKTEKEQKKKSDGGATT